MTSHKHLTRENDMKTRYGKTISDRSLTSKAVTYKGLGGYDVIEFVERRFERLRLERSVSEVKARSSGGTSCSAIQAGPI